MATTDVARRPPMPPAGKPGVCRFGCGKPVLTAKGARSKKTEHPECAERWRRWNRADKVRAAVFARADGHRCVDCHQVFPESALEVDHVRGLLRGGANDPSNYAPRCLKCHARKTAREKTAQSKTARTRGTRGAGDVTAVPDPPNTARYMATAGRVWMSGVVTLVAGWPWVDQVPPTSVDEWVAGAQAAIPEAPLLAVVPALVPVGVWWGLRRRRNRAVNAQIVFERLARTVGEPAVDRSHKFRARRWRGGMPTEVTLRLGTGFDPGDEDARRKLVDEFAAIVGVDPAAVAVTGHGKSGVRVSVRDTIPATDTPELEDTPGPGEDTWAGEVAEVLRPIIDEDTTVTVVDRDSGRPRLLHVTYPKRAAARSAKAKMPVLQQMRDSYPQPGREWFITHEAPTFRFVLESHPDPLRSTVPVPDLTTPDLHAGIHLGLTETGEPWLMPLAGPAAHLFCAGLSGAGKGSIEWATIRALAPAIRDGWVRLWIIDPKQGAELGALEPMCAGFAGNDDEALPLLNRLTDLVDGKYGRLRATGLRRLDTFTPTEPFDLLLIDEAASLYGGSDKKRNDQMMAVTKRLVNISRAAGVALHVYTQDPLVQSFPARDLFPRRLALRLGSADHVDRVLGAGAKDGGALAWRIPETQPGTGFLVVNGNVATPLRVRAAYVTDREISRIVRDFTPARPAPPTRRVTAEATPALTDPPPPNQDEDGWVFLDDLADGVLPVRVFLDSNDPDPATVTGITDDPEDPDRWLIEFRYDGEQSTRKHPFDKGDSVRLATRPV